MNFRYLVAAILLAFMVFNPADAQYCASGATSTFDSECDSVKFGTINNGTPGICATYSDFTMQSTMVNIGQTVPIRVTVGTCGGTYTRSGKVFIDWNQNGLLTDPGEEVFVFGPSSGAAQQGFSGSVTVPVTAVVGATRMRVVVQETGLPANILPCGTFTWGETEDYTVNVQPSAPNDIGVTAITSPSSGCNLTAAEQVTVSITNFGTNSQTAFNVHYRINGGAVVTENVGALVLATATTQSYTFATTANMATPGTYTIESWTSLAGDAYAVNDTTTKVVTGIPGVSTFPYVEDFESGQGGWLSGGTASTWAYGTPAKPVINSAASGSYAWVTGGLGSGDYNNNEDSYVIGPCFDFSSLNNPWISLSVWWNAEFSWDGAVLQSSTDFGLTWQNVGQFGDPNFWYTDNTINGNPGGQQEGWTGRNSTANGSGQWRTAAHRLDGLALQPSVRLRIAFGSDGSVTDDGFAFDDVRIGEGPVLNMGPDQLLCGGDSLVLDAGPWANYQWSTGAQTQYDTITSLQVGQIIVTAYDSLGFYDIDTVVVALSYPTVNLGPDTLICPGQTVTFDAANPGGTYNWNTGDTTQIITVGTGGPVIINVLDSVGCPATDTAIVTLGVQPVVNLGNDTTICTGNPLAIDAGAGVTGTTYQWNSGLSTQVIVISSPGVYAVVMTSPQGCSATDSITVSAFPTPALNLGPDRTECGPYTLDAGAGGTSYAWSTGAATQTINNTTGGTYIVTVTNSFGCSSVDTVVITMAGAPTVSLGPDLVLCNGQTATLDAGNPGSTYFWSNGGLTQTITVNSPGTYIVNVTNTAGCVGSDTVNITGSNLLVNLGPDVDICGNDPITLDAGNPGLTYSWSNGASTQTITVTSAGTYTVTVTDPLGCDGTDNVVVTQQTGITAGINNPATGTLFAPVQFTDNSSPAATAWNWDFGDGSTSTQQNPSHTYLAFGNFTITLIAWNGSCSDTTTSTIDINNFVGVEEEDLFALLEVYPNPSSGHFTLNAQLLVPSDLHLEVTDLTGRKLWEEYAGNAAMYRTEFDLNTAQGIYLLKLETSQGTVWRKLIVQ